MSNPACASKATRSQFLLERISMTSSSPTYILLIRAVYVANILVAGQVGWISVFARERAARFIFEGTMTPNSAISLVGCFWLAIAALSFVGLFAPLQLSAVLVIQLLYKGLWLLAIAFPAIASGQAETMPMTLVTFFVIWVIVLPFVIPFRYLLNL